MSLAAAERFLSLLVREPDGVANEAARRALGSDPGPVAAELVRRGHFLHASSGVWHLECAGSHFDPAAFEDARGGRFGEPLEVWEEAASTNDLARAAAEAEGPPGAVWVAERQSHGRGRQGRSWECAAHAGLLFSVLPGFPSVVPSRATLLPLAIGLACCESLRETTRLDVRPKWPNDLLLGGRKLAGMLVETLPRRSRAVLGIGLNVRAGAGPEGVHAASLEEFGAVPGRELLLSRLLEAIERRYEAWCSGATENLAREYAALETSLGRRVRARIGETTIEGTAVRLSEHGLLCVETGSGVVRELSAGEVHLL